MKRALRLLCMIALAPLASAAAPTTAVPPDISGTWKRSPAPGSVASSPTQPPPLRERYAHAYKPLHQQAGPPREVPKCIYQGMPSVMAAREPLEILQTPGQVTVLAQYMTQTRRIFLDEALPAPDDINPGYMGYSVAKWHGNTLEVQTAGIREDVRYLDIPHSARMKLFEKIHLAAPDLLQDDITIVDPDTLTGPYKLTFTYKKDPNHRILEYACDHGGVAANQSQTK